MNNTLVPLHILLLEAVIEIAGVTTGFTVVLITFELAVFGEAQVLAEVITHQILSLFAKPAVLYVMLFPPTLIPFTFH